MSTITTTMAPGSTICYYGLMPGGRHGAGHVLTVESVSGDQVTLSFDCDVCSEIAPGGICIIPVADLAPTRKRRKLDDFEIMAMRSALSLADCKTHDQLAAHLAATGETMLDDPYPAAFGRACGWLRTLAGTVENLAG